MQIVIQIMKIEGGINISFTVIQHILCGKRIEHPDGEPGEGIQDKEDTELEPVTVDK